MVLCCLFWCQSFCDVSSYVCSNYFSSVATFWEITAHSVDHMFSLYFEIEVISGFGFEGLIWVLQLLVFAYFLLLVRRWDGGGG